MINKKFAHYDLFETFNSLKLSMTPDNTKYKVGLGGDLVTGEPDFPYQTVIFVKETKTIFTHGQLYDCSGKLEGVMINDTLFTGEDDIITEIWGKTRKFQIEDGEPVDVNGSQDVQFKLPDLLDHKVTKDSEGNIICSTYATKEELDESLGSDGFKVFIGENDDPPTMSMEPFVSWTEKELNEHAGDFYVTSSGYVYKLYQNLSNVWEWKPVVDHTLYELQKKYVDLEKRLKLLEDELYKKP